MVDLKVVWRAHLKVGSKVDNSVHKLAAWSEVLLAYLVGRLDKTKAASMAEQKELSRVEVWEDSMVGWRAALSERKVVGNLDDAMVGK